MNKSHRNSMLFWMALLASTAWVAPAHALPFFAPDDRLPNPAQPHVSNGPIVYPGVPGGPIAIEMLALSLSGPGLQSPTPTGPGTWAVDSFFDVFFQIEPVGPPGPTQQGTNNAAGHVQGTGADTGPNTRLIDTEMLQLDLGSPSGIMIRESPTLPSQGQTQITDVGGGMYHIDSFFDVFTEISIDGGGSWYPSQGPAHLTSLPEPSSIVLLAIAGVVLIRVARRRRAVR
jgi:hypothetical protein